jgi:hypothetical protein
MCQAFNVLSINCFFQKIGERFIEIETTVKGEDLYPTKKGDWVKSIPEQMIANYLFDNHISYKYEDPVVATTGKYFRPDFFLPKYKAWIEYYGLAGQNPFYDRQRQWKFKQFESLNMHVIRLYHGNVVSLDILGQCIEKEIGKSLVGQGALVKKLA